MVHIHNLPTWMLRTHQDNLEYKARQAAAVEREASENRTRCLRSLNSDLRLVLGNTMDHLQGEFVPDGVYANWRNSGQVAKLYEPVTSIYAVVSFRKMTGEISFFWPETEEEIRVKMVGVPVLSGVDNDILRMDIVSAFVAAHISLVNAKHLCVKCKELSARNDDGTLCRRCLDY